MPTSRSDRGAGDLLRALANPHRLEILSLLSAGEMSVGGLQSRLSLSQSALSQHLARLRAQGLVATRRCAQTIHYRIADNDAVAMANALLTLMAHRAVPTVQGDPGP